MDLLGKEKKNLLIASSVGVVAALIGIVLATSSVYIVDLIISTNLVLSPESSSYPMWADLPIPIKTSVYIFNVTNAEQFSSRGAKPELKQVGPYVFLEHRKKVGIVWNDANGTVSYKQVRTYFWDPDSSKGSLNDSLVILNVPGASVSDAASRMDATSLGLMNMGLGVIGEKLFTSQTVGKILFDGYKDPLLNAAEFLNKFNVKLPGVMDKFGFFYQRNGSNWMDGLFNIYTGASSIKKLGMLSTWNYTKHTQYYPDKCGEVRGAVDLFPPYLQDQTLELYSNDLCRPLTLQWHDQQSVKGISGYRYLMDKSFLANKSENADNWCYDLGKGFLPSGMFNASACRFGAPIFLSQPHFYQADPYYKSLLGPDSVSPDEELHKTEVVVETTSGIPVQVVARFQVNVLLERNDHLSLFSDIAKRTFFPVLWFESRYEVPDFLVAKLWVLSHLRNILIVVGILIFCAGVFAVVISRILYSKQKNQSATDKALIVEQQEQPHSDSGDKPEQHQQQQQQPVQEIFD